MIGELMGMDWYLWEREPGVIGISRCSQMDRHGDTYIESFMGSLEDAIRYAKQLEERGYDVVPKAVEAGEKTGTEEKAEPVPLIEEPGFQYAFAEVGKSAVPERKPRKKREKEQDRDPFANYEAEGQISLFEYINT